MKISNLAADLLPLALATTAISTAKPQAGGSSRLPNVIIIFFDDHGYTDLGIHGIDANVSTPHMDSLAKGGALMMAGYSTAPQCRPSRYGRLACI